MKGFQQNIAILTGIALTATVTLTGKDALADQTIAVLGPLEQVIDETVITPLNFGTIGAAPGGDTITINARANGASAKAVAAGGSDMSANNSTPGNVEISSAITFDVDITVPSFVHLTGDTSNDTITVTDIINNTTADYTHDGATGTSNVYVGGVLTIPSSRSVDHNDTYRGTLNVQLVYN